MSLKPEASDNEVIFSQSFKAKENCVQSEQWFDPSSKRSRDNLLQPDGPTITEPRPITLKDNWIRRHGHTISFSGLFFFTIVLYVRPYETIPALSSLLYLAFYAGLFTLVAFILTQLSLEGNLTARPREVNLVLLLGVSALLSIPFADEPTEAWTTFNEILLKALLMFIVIVNVVRTKRRLQLLLLLAVGVSVYLSISAILDYQAGIFKIGKLDNARIGGSIAGLFENSNDLALHLATIAPLAFVLGFTKTGVIRKLFFIGIACLMFAGVIVTFSRGGFLGLIAAGIVLIVKLGWKNKLFTGVVLTLALTLFLAFAPGDYSGRIFTIFNLGADLTGSASQRSLVLQRSVLVALRYPVLGVGLGNFHHRSIQELQTHNGYTQIGTEMGLVAMVIYMMFLLHPYKRLTEIQKATFAKEENRYFYYVAVGLQASLMAYMVASFFAAVAYQWYIYYLVGYSIALRRIYQTSTEVDPASKEYTV